LVSFNLLVDKANVPHATGILTTLSCKKVKLCYYSSTLHFFYKSAIKSWYFVSQFISTQNNFVLFSRVTGNDLLDLRSDLDDNKMFVE